MKLICNILKNFSKDRTLVTVINCRATHFNYGIIPCFTLKAVCLTWYCSIFAAMQHAQEDLQVRWLKLRIKLKQQFGIKPDMDGILFLIGVQELGTAKQVYTKEQKQDLMHIAICTLLGDSGYYIKEGYDEEGWPHFKQLKPLPEFNVYEQENFLKDHVLLYFEQVFKNDN